MRRRSALLLLVGLALGAGGASAGPDAARAERVATGATFVLTGHGWGHGVGLSQCGALGYADHAWKHGAILRHYYPGTALSAVPAARVRVLLADGRASVSITSRGAFKVTDGDGTTYPLPAGTYELGASLKVKVDAKKPARALPAPVTFVPGGTALVLDRPYRGQIVVKPAGGKLRVVNSVPLEQYLYGVVPLEIGSSGPAEALKAQAVAARSYALANRRAGDFDLYPDTRSQVYGGVDAERKETNAAVDATAARALTYKGKVIAAYYFASSGGRTAAVEDAWPGSRPVPYLPSVEDPYDDVCSEHNWGPFVFSGVELARKLHVGGRVTDVRAAVNPSQRVTSLSIRTSKGQVSIPGATIRRVLGLRSTWFRFGVLSLARPAGAAVYGTEVELTGVARGLGGVALQQRVPGRQWARLARVRPRPDGTFTARVKPKQTLEYRLSAGTFSGGAVRVAVAPRLRLELGVDGLYGSIRPAISDVRVELQRQTSSGWARATVARTDARGEFAVTQGLAEGTYRARVGARRGYAAATSAPVRVAV